MVATNTEAMYKTIKKQNGEEFAKILRENVLLDIPNLKHILEYAGKDPEDAMKLVPLLREIKETSNEEIEFSPEEEIKDPIDLLNEAGYNAFYVKSLRQQNSIKKYFKPNERLCTFNDPNRYKDYYIIHAVKKNIASIKRGNPPEREDEYGTSVISIQIAKSGGFISIKNRYNHTVDNPDATFNNNPGKIIPGLTAALKKKFGVDFIAQETRVLSNYRTINAQLVRFNYEADNIYYDEKYYFSGSTITKLNPDYELMLDVVILDTRTSTVRTVSEIDNPETKSLLKVLTDELSGYKVKTEKNKKTGETIINIIGKNKETKELLRTKNGRITSLHLYKTTELGDSFLKYNKVLKELYAPKLKKTGEHCFNRNECLTTLYIPELEEMGRMFFYNNSELTHFSAPKLKKMGTCCFSSDRQIKEIYIPELEEMGSACFLQTDELTEMSAPKLKKLGQDCFIYNAKLKRIHIPMLEEIEENFANTKYLQELIAPNLKKISDRCFTNTIMITHLDAPKLNITKSTPKSIRLGVKLTRFKKAIESIIYSRKNKSINNNTANLQRG